MKSCYFMLFSFLLFLNTGCISQKKQEYTGYLFAYFEGKAEGRMSQEQLRFAVSSDAVSWKALNNNEPVVSSEVISKSGGIRDPHLLRCENGKTFYIVATDMSTATNGWKENPGITMLRSDDLINWTHSIIDFPTRYPEKFGNAYWVWAPQTIYDPKAGKYLVYFTIKYKDDDKLDFYGAYANEDFTAFESEPFLLFSPKYGGIDADIIPKNGKYHFFYKGNTKNEEGKEVNNGIQQAIGTSLQGPWVEDFVYLDPYAGTNTNVEGSSVFRLNNSDEYILMYDLYGRGRYEFQRSTDLFQFTEKPESFTKDFYPRHGSVMSITRKEAKILNGKWGGVPEELLKE